MQELAAGYDASAEHVHPHYLALQAFLIAALHKAQADRYVVDLGGGTGRLAERILATYPHARVLVVDQSEPALEIARSRLAPFGNRAATGVAQLQVDWESLLAESPSAVVSMSAIHHLDALEKQDLYRRCYLALAPGGLFANADEIRDENNAVYLAQMKAWGQHMDRKMAAGHVHPSFHDALHQWKSRNIDRFSEPRRSGDDCHQTIAEQLDYLRIAGFATADCPWRQDMWAVLRGTKER